MTRIQRPTDDRTSTDLLCWEQPGTPIDEPASCPLLQTVHLLPIRYGRVEVAPADTDPGYPYSLTSRPLGYRLLRHGYLYVLDADTGELHEYLHENGELTGHNGGKLEYPKQHTLYVCFTDVPMTERKKAQILDSEEERAYFMQEIDLASASPVSGGRHLLTPGQAKQWVAEFAEDYTPDAPEDGHPQEGEPYHWENQPYYHKTRFGKLIKQQTVEDPDDCLCLVLQDDVGVMLDLAQHQDDVVDWLDGWAASGEQEGHAERDYVLGSLIESMTTISDEVLGQTAASTGDEALDALIDDTTATERQSIYQYLEVRKDYRGPEPLGSEAFLLEHHGDNPLVQAQMNMIETLGYDRFQQHRPAINALNLQNYYKLNGAKLGQRGINDLIDRKGMAEFLAAQRKKLARWHALLEKITDDRTTLLCDSRFHKAAWYFDGQDETQVLAALDLQYGCMKDVCRSDSAAERVSAWIDANPQYARPLFHTLSLAEQAQDHEPYTTYASIGKAGYDLTKNSLEWAQTLKNAEAGRLPDVKALSEDIQLKAAAVGDTVSPAMALGLARALQPLYEASEGKALPPLDDIFRDLPFFFKGQMLDAINAGKVEFKVASPNALATFQDNIRRLMALSDQLRNLAQDHDLAKARHGHRSETATRLVEEFKATREEHRELGRRVAAGMSPVEETQHGIKLEPAESGRAGLTVLAPVAANQAIGNAMADLRLGRVPSLNVNTLGDGMGVLVAVAQAVNFYSVTQATFSEDREAIIWRPFIESAFATAGAGFLAAQSISDTLLTARATKLAGAWQRGALQAVHIRLGMLHVGLGGVSYLAGIMGYGLSTMKHAGEWIDAMKTGNSAAATGAALSSVGSAGLTVTSTQGLRQTINTVRAIRQVPAGQERALAWARSGTRLSSLFARLNLFGLAFSVFELAGTWLYNRYNLSERDKWLLSTPWGTEPERNKNLSLAEYEAALAALAEPVSITPANEAGNGDSSEVILNIHNWGPNALNHDLALAQKEPHRLSLSAWQVQPARSGMLNRLPETWIRSAAPIIESMQVLDSIDHLQLQFTVPQPVKTKYGKETRDLVVMVRLETLGPDGVYRTHDHLLTLPPKPEFPVSPVDGAPHDTPVWRPVRQPLTALDLYP
ncbi:toxin VasX [uncultured Marinobacter sp.]|uniref:toxin VasX n=1 Tax=uncultured Marinobacter sp. TaxID=187379 RepID=UPI002583BB4E|nr:toxin VasX [uncultured Marinobacter sp.]